MDEKEKSTEEKIDWMDKITADFIKAISRKYSLLEIFILWMVFTVINGVLSAVVLQIVLMVLVVMSLKP